ncbi:Protein trachealess [Armadillidium vulgare]|nr:Protein trachealess [Armadillidium vulgare]
MLTIRKTNDLQVLREIRIMNKFINIKRIRVEMTGSSVFDYIHSEDHQEMADQLCLTLSTGQPMPSPSSLTSEDNNVSSQGTMNPDVSTCMTFTSSGPFKGFERSFCIRMKSTLTKRGCHFKSSGYRVVLIIGHMRAHAHYSHSRKNPPSLMGFVALAIALPPPSVHEVRLESDMFVTRLNFDFRIAHCEPRVSDLLDYTPDEFQGRSLYSLCHAQDVEKIKRTHNDLMKKGQVMSPYFRILNKRGGFTWMQICATIICSSKNGEEQNIICVNYVLRFFHNYAGFLAKTLVFVTKHLYFKSVSYRPLHIQ